MAVSLIVAPSAGYVILTVGLFPNIKVQSCIEKRKMADIIINAIINFFFIIISSNFYLMLL